MKNIVSSLKSRFPLINRNYRSFYATLPNLEGTVRNDPRFQINSEPGDFQLRSSKIPGLNNLRSQFLVDSKIRILSDLHLEYPIQLATLRENIRKTSPQYVLPDSQSGEVQFNYSAKYCALIGDIGDPRTDLYRDFLYSSADSYEKVFVVLGNHECYFQTIARAEDQIAKICQSRSNLFFLNNSFVQIDEGYKIYGTPLWSDLSGLSKEEFNRLKKSSRDFRHIHNFNPDHSNTILLLQQHLSQNQNPTIILSHYSPTFLALQKFGKYVFPNGERVKELFASNLEEIIIQNPHIKYWAYGHTHLPFRSYLPGTTTELVSNPMGYNPDKYGFEYDTFLNLSE